MAPFSSCTSVLSTDRRDEACQINQIKKPDRSNTGRFDRVKGFYAGEQGQNDLKEVDMLADSESGFFLSISSKYAVRY